MTRLQFANVDQVIGEMTEECGERKFLSSISVDDGRIGFFEGSGRNRG